MRSRHASSAMADYGSRRPARIVLAAVLPVLVLLHECAAELVFYGIQGTMLAADAGEAAVWESTLQDALTSRTFAYAPIVVGPVLQQAAQLDGRRIEGSFRFNEALIVSYAASPSTGGAAG